VDLGVQEDRLIKKLYFAIPPELLQHEEHIPSNAGIVVIPDRGVPYYHGC
jgi:hypothetical protein